MKVVVVFLLLPSFVQSQLPAEQLASQYSHLYEVNKEWACQSHVKAFKTSLQSFPNDPARISFHLSQVEQLLRDKPMKGLNAKQKKNRQALLDVLREYWQAGEFPINLYHDQRQPYFVDHRNVACAVGQLLRASGEDQLVAEIKQADNYAYISELIKYPGLLSWAEENGFSVDELAWIQPAYPSTTPGFPFENNQGVTGKVNKLYAFEDLLYFVGEFTAIDGVAGDNIIAFDGEEWHIYPGIEGSIVDILIPENSPDDIYIIGQFKISGNEEIVNIARWNSEEWKALQVGDMEGDVSTIFQESTTLFVGGSFQKINGQDQAYVAVYNLIAEEWIGEENLVVNGPVYCGSSNGGKLLLAGDFSEVGDQGSTVTNLAYFERSSKQWIIPPAHEQGPIQHMLEYEDVVYTASEFGDINPFAILHEGSWKYFPAMSPFGDGLFHGFAAHPDIGAVFYGGFISGVFIVATGISGLTPDGLAPGVVASDASIHAAAFWDNKLVMVGDFTELGNASANGIGFINAVAPNSTNTPEANLALAEIYQYQESLYINDLNTSGTAQLAIYNINGQQIQTAKLGSVRGTQTLSLSNLPSGVYAYQLVSEGRRMSGQFVLTK